MRKATKQADYSIVGEAVHIKQVDKSFALESGDATDEELEAAKVFLEVDYGYEELANFREGSDIAEILQNASDEAKLDKAYVATLSTEPKETPAETTSEMPSDDELPF